MKTGDWFRTTQNASAHTMHSTEEIPAGSIGRISSSRRMRVEIWTGAAWYPRDYILESWDGCEPISAWDAWKLRQKNARMGQYADTQWYARMVAIGDALQDAGLRPVEATPLNIRLMPETGLSRSDLLAKIAGAIGDDWTQIGVSRFGIRIRWPWRPGYWK